MESQNHYYGHSGAFARYVGLHRPRHIRGLVQHGWTALSPVATHFRDFPTVGAAGGRAGRALFVWSHASRAWSPTAEDRSTVPIGAPWLYLCATAEASTPPAGTVILPVHGIPTQRLHGDHRATARAWFDTEGPSTVCLYHVEAEDPRVVEAYVEAGHHCVTLGLRTDAAFLARLHRLLSGAARVVSNRLSTPVVYAAGLGIDVGVHGPSMRLEGEDLAAQKDLQTTWPELYDASASLDERRAVALDELGAQYVREPGELRALLGWDRAWRVGPFVDHWLAAPGSRAVTTVRRRSSTTETTAAPGGSDAPEPMGAAAWLRGAMSYLPHPLGRVVDPASVTPFPVPRPSTADGT